MDKMREEFEVWAESQNVSILRDGETYYHHTSHHMWYAWKASRAALVVELPPNRIATDVYMEDEVKAALDKVGIKYE